MCSWLLSGVTACTYLAFSSNMNPPSLVPSQSWDGIFCGGFCNISYLVKVHRLAW